MKFRLVVIIIFFCVALTFVPNTNAEYYFYTPLYGHSDYVYCITFSPDGSILASGSADNTIRIWDTSSAKTKKILKGHTRRINSVVFYNSIEKQKMLLASCSDDGSIRIWDTDTGNTMQILNPNAGKVHSVAFSPNENILASGSSDGVIRFWDVNSGKTVKTFSQHKSPVNKVRFSPNGKILASCGNDGSIRLWDIVSGNNTQTIAGHIGIVHDMMFSPNGQNLVSCSDDGTVRLWDISTQKMKILKRYSKKVRCVAFSPDGRTIASGGDNRIISIYSTEIEDTIQTLELKHKDTVFCLTFSPDSWTLANGIFDGTIRLWDQSTNNKEVLRLHQPGTYNTVFSPDDRMLASGNKDGTIILWDKLTGKTKNILNGNIRNVRSSAFSSDGLTLASICVDRRISLWNTKTGKRKKTFTANMDVWSSSISPDGNLIACGGREGFIHSLNLYSQFRQLIGIWRGRSEPIGLWNTKTGRIKKILFGHKDIITAITFSPDGETLASGSEDNSIRLWDIKTGRLKRKLPGGAYCLAFSPDGNTLAGGLSTINLWDINTGEKKILLKGHKGSVMSIAFSPNEEMLASGGYDGSIRLWNTNSGKIKDITWYRWTISNVKFSVDGQTLFSSGGGTLISWDIRTIIKATSSTN